MDPITLATATAAITSLGTEVMKGAASKVGEDVWLRIKGLFGWKSDPAPAELPKAAATTMHGNDELLKQVIAILSQHNAGQASSFIGTINAQKVVAVQGSVNTINMGD
ncbi:MAG TPA: hypothetical protein VHS31_08465 [Tepidisphaeraceae bacterium]|jgi:hypothetical protein|nr:hypothetical protein [Tepidisphaeraceae bacterium]